MFNQEKQRDDFDEAGQGQEEGYDFDSHGDIWTDVTCRRIEHQEHDVFRRRHLKKFREGNVSGGIFVIWIDPPHDKDR